MSDRPLSELADEAGIESTYISESGEYRVVPDEVKRALLDLMEVTPGAGREDAPPDAAEPCFVPDWLRKRRAWGVSAQLYGVRSRRNAGIGDFEDLAQLAETLARSGADFIGVNPLHALFSTDPDRASPYSPSSKSFLNPIYIAVDQVPGATSEDEAELEPLRHADFVDYTRVAALKRCILERAFAVRGANADFAAFCEAGGDALDRFAIFEALSEHFSSQGLGSGWHSWPEQYRDPAATEVAVFASTHGDRVRFHKWLQWIAASQLAAAQRRAVVAGMRIGVYLDLAVGVSPDGAAAWSDSALYATGARVGCPPDMFNHLGQDWGLAPMRPTTLSQRRMEPFERELSASMRAAGAVRIDHVMSLARLYWLPSGSDARSGGYVRYPIEDLLNVLGRCSREHRCLVIGEDLGTVPPGFRDKMRDHHILSYRVLYFEREWDGMFKPPWQYPKEALACVATHDLPPLLGWWRGADIDARISSDLYEQPEGAQQARHDRAHQRERLMDSLRREQLLQHDADAHAAQMPDDAFVAVHRYIARAPSWLFAVQLEDIAGAVEMVNLPGTDRQHANWRRKLPVTIEELPGLERVRRTLDAIAAERPR
jgi:4-alpha-glucanotransferase